MFNVPVSYEVPKMKGTIIEKRRARKGRIFYNILSKELRGISETGVYFITH